MKWNLFCFDQYKMGLKLYSVVDGSDAQMAWLKLEFAGIQKVQVDKVVQVARYHDTFRTCSIAVDCHLEVLDLGGKFEDFRIKSSDISGDVTCLEESKAAPCYNGEKRYIKSKRVQ